MKGWKPRTQVDRRDAPAEVRAYDELRRKIVHGELAEGTVLSEVETSNELGLSRTPVRAAMRALLNDGLVQEGARRQCVVNGPTPTVVREVHLMRTALEVLAVREAAQPRDIADFDVLRLIMIRMRRAFEAGDLHAVLDAEDEFHVQVCAIAGLPIVADTVFRLLGQARLNASPRAFDTEELRIRLEEHDELIEALDRFDAFEAARLLASHLARRHGAMARPSAEQEAFDA